MNIDYARAIRALPRSPEPCPRHGTRARFQLDGYYLYACAVCEAAPWGSHEGVYHGPLRAACDPTWSWVPSSQRAAVAAYGMLGASDIGRPTSPLLSFDVLDGHVWVADRANGLRLDVDETWLPPMAKIAWRFARVEVFQSRVAGLVAAPGYVECPPPTVPFVSLVDELYPGASWCSRGEGPLVAWRGEQPVAFAMPASEEARAAA
jgi:hypothetical protein